MEAIRIVEVCGVSAILGFVGGLFGLVGVPPAACVAYSYALATADGDGAET